MACTRIRAQSYQAAIRTSDLANISNDTDTNLTNPWGLVAGLPAIPAFFL